MVTKLADDLLDGADEISRFTGWSKRRVFYLLEKGQLPGFKVGNKWCARRSTLTEHIQKLERGEAA
jgi:excisionase family DNA binding protein